MAPKIFQLPTANMSPRTLLAQALEEADEMSAVFVVCRYKPSKEAQEGSHRAIWSNCSVDHLCTAARFLDSTATDLLRGYEDDDICYPDEEA